MLFHMERTRLLAVDHSTSCLPAIAALLCAGWLLTHATPPAHAAIIFSGDVSPADPADWSVNISAKVGASSTGTVTIDDGSVLSCSRGYLGYEPGSSGMVTVAGNRSKWKGQNDLYVGYSGNGTLNIEGGGKVFGTTGYVGYNPGSIGTVMVTGAGSEWSVGGYGLFVGHSTSGTLNIEAGGRVISSNTARLGREVSSTGTVAVTGAGSRWVHFGNLFVGCDGSGTLTVTDGGTVMVTTLYASLSDLSGNGTIAAQGAVLDADLLFDGAHGSQQAIAFGAGGSLTLNVTGTVGLGAGYRDTGTLTITEGVTVASASGYLGYHSGSAGTATVTGDGSKWTNSSDLYIGRSGSGMLHVADGGSVIAKTLYASLSALSGDGTITSQGAVLDADLVFDGSHPLQQSVPFGTGGTLNLNVDGTGHLGAGHKGTGSLRIAEGVTATSAGGYIGYQPGSTGTATVTGTGSKWTNSGYLYVGFSGSGTLNIEAGGQVSNSSCLLGYDPGSSGTATVSGTGSRWTNSGDLNIGDSGRGTLTIAAGGEVSSTTGFVGRWLGSTGTATVTGSGSKWTNSGSLYVGLLGNGTLTVTNGGSVTAKTLYAALNDLAGNGTITSQGAVLDGDLRFDSTRGLQQTIAFGTGGKLNLNVDGTGEVGAGYKATGTLRIADGVNVTSSSGLLGSQSGSNGTATVTGAGSQWTNSGSLSVGSYGSGTLNVQAAGKVSNTIGYLGLGVGTSGTATVTGSGSKWTSTSTFYVGYSGSGTLDITAGGEVSTTNAYLGYNSGSTAAATVTGAWSKWTNSGDLFVGRSSRGTLTVTSGGLVTTKTLCAPLSDLMGNGTITAKGVVLDADLLFNSTRGTQQSITFGTGGVLSLNVDGTAALGAGYRGIGTLRIAQGITVTSSTGYLGYWAGSTGTATITGTGSKWISNAGLYVGNEGRGMLTVEAGGQVSSGMFYLGTNYGSHGTATVSGTGSKLSCSILSVGSFGNGTLNIEAGGEVSASTGIISFMSDTTCMATVTGIGSKWTNSGYFYVGRLGNGTLNITAGGQVSNTTGYVGSDSSAVGTANVAGTNSKWTNSSSLYVGGAGVGTLNIEAGGQVTNEFGYLGNGSGSSGSATVTGTDSKWTNSGYLYVGRLGDGTLNITAGGQVSNITGYVGSDLGSIGTATVAGTNSKWTNSSDLYVGRAGNGTLNIGTGGGGGLVTAKTVILADTSSGTGTVNLDQGGTLQAATIRQGAGAASFNWNDGTIRNFDASTNLAVLSGPTLKLAATGTHAFYIDPGRTGTVDAVLADATTGGTLAKTGAGTLTLTGVNTYSGHTAVEAGRLKVTGSIGNSTSVTIDALATLELARSAGSATAADLAVTNAGTLVVSTAAQEVGLLAGPGVTQLGAGASLTADAIRQDTLSIGAGGSLVIRQAAGGAPGVNPVPEPGTWALLIAAALCLVPLCRWRRVG